MSITALQDMIRERAIKMKAQLFPNASLAGHVDPIIWRESNSWIQDLHYGFSITSSTPNTSS